MADSVFTRVLTDHPSAEACPALGLYPGSARAVLSRRLGARLVDLVFLFIAVVLFSPVVVTVLPLPAVAYPLTACVLHWLHTLALEGSGQLGSAGKRLFQLRVLGPDGSRPTRARVFARRLADDAAVGVVAAAAFVLMLRRQYGAVALPPGLSPADVAVWIGLAASVGLGVSLAFVRRGVFVSPGERVCRLVVLFVPVLAPPVARLPDPAPPAPLPDVVPSGAEQPMPPSELARLPLDASVTDPSAPESGVGASEAPLRLNQGDEPSVPPVPDVLLDGLSAAVEPDAAAPDFLVRAGSGPPAPAVSPPDAPVASPLVSVAPLAGAHRSRRLGFRSVGRAPSYRD